MKVRGFRIELGEIESALDPPPGRAGGRRPGGARRRRRRQPPDRLGGDGRRTPPRLAGELRPFLGQSLPDYMVPAAFALLAALPLTPNGKIDRRALAALPLQPEATGADAAERRAAVHAREALAGSGARSSAIPVYRDDNFFELGGHSLLASPGGLAAPLGLERGAAGAAALPSPVLREWRRGSSRRSSRGAALPAADRAGSPRRATCRSPSPSSGSGSSTAWSRGRPPSTCRRPSASPAVSTPGRSRGPSTRSRGATSRCAPSSSNGSGRGIQQVQPPAPRAAAAGRPLRPARAPGASPRPERLAAEEARLPFDLARGPLLRTTLLRLGAADALLLVTLHHIVTDGWSTGVFARELRALYAAFAAGRPSPLPELPLQYPDFAVWQRSALTGGGGRGPAGRLDSAGSGPRSRRSTADRPAAAAAPDLPGRHRSLQLSAELSLGVQKLAQRAGVTLFMTLLAAFQALLHRYTGQERIVVGSPVAGRNRPELEGLIGFFVNTLVLPGDFAGDLTFRQLLERSREMALGAYACQDLPFEKLVETLQPVRDKSRSPLFQVMFLVQQTGGPQAAPQDGGGLHIEPYDVGTGTSQFDLTLFAAEAPEGLLTAVEYNTDLFDAATMDRLLEDYRESPGGRRRRSRRPAWRTLPLPPLTETPQARAATAAGRAARDHGRRRGATASPPASPSSRRRSARRWSGGSREADGQLAEARIRGVGARLRGAVARAQQQAGAQAGGGGGVQLAADVAQEQEGRRRQGEGLGDRPVGGRLLLGAGGGVVEALEEAGEVAVLGVAEEQLLGLHAPRGEDPQPHARGAPRPPAPGARPGRPARAALPER